MAARIGITIGDIGGIGPEVALRAATALRHAAALRQVGEVAFTLIGPGAAWREHARALANVGESALEGLAMEDTADPDAGAAVAWGATNARHGAVALAAIHRGVAMCRAGLLDGLVTAPISKEGIAAAGCPHPGHTEILAELTGVADSTMMLVGGGLRVALATVHVAIVKVPYLLNAALIHRRLDHTVEFLHRLGIERPRVVVCGLNPHAGEGGLFGDEERQIIAPAVKSYRGRDAEVIGPVPGDTAFFPMRRGDRGVPDAVAAPDAVLAMYHDQGLVAIKTLAFDEGVNVTLGIPIVRTSPDHGTAFGIAGRGTASPNSMTAAARLAIELSEQQQAARKAATT